MTTQEARRRREVEMRWLQRVTLAIVLVLAFYQLVIVNPNNDTTHTALCALRSDLASRVAQTDQFLAHPQTAPSFNDPKTLALIKSQVEGQRRTINALSVLSCD